MTAVSDFFNNLASGWNAAEQSTPAEIFAFISERLKIESGMDVLDVGCGTGIITDSLYALSRKKVTAIDISDRMIDIAKQTHDENTACFLCADFFDFTSEKKFDYAVCFNAFPHFIEVDKFVSKMNEVLKTGGICAVMHNFSRKKLASHHRALSENVSRTIESADREASRFSSFFDVISTIDDDNEYLILLKKR